MPRAPHLQRQTWKAAILGLCVLFGTMGFALYYQFSGLKLDGVSLILVCVLIVSWSTISITELNLVKFQLAHLWHRARA
jgi:hypothetical protein